MQIDLSTITPEQLVAIGKQLRQARRTHSGDPKARATVIDRMLQEKDGTEFKHTTADILAALQDAKIVGTCTPAERAIELKKIQTRKQLLVKKGKSTEEIAANKLKYGYKVSAAGFAITLDRVLAWLTDASSEDKAAIRKAAK